MISERLIESINMVKELLQSNRDLRDSIHVINKKNDQNDIEIYNLNVENQDLRDKIEVLENIIGRMSKQGGVPAANVSFQNVNNRKGQIQQQPNYSPLDSIAQEIVELRKTNRLLETRLKHLELQNIQMAANMDHMGNNEPTRPIFVEDQPSFHIEESKRDRERDRDRDRERDRDWERDEYSGSRVQSAKRIPTPVKPQVVRPPLPTAGRNPVRKVNSNGTKFTTTTAGFGVVPERDNIFTRSRYEEQMRNTQSSMVRQQQIAGNPRRQSQF